MAWLWVYFARSKVCLEPATSPSEVIRSEVLQPQQIMLSQTSGLDLGGLYGRKVGITSS